MIQQVTVRNFKRFREQKFDLAGSVVLAGPNNAGKSTLLQAIVAWRLGLDRWLAQRQGGGAVKRAGVAITRADFTAVPLRETNLLWEGRKVTGPKGMAGTRRLIEIIVEGRDADGQPWRCGVEFQYDNPELLHVRPLGGRDMDRDAMRNFPPSPAAELDIVHIPPLSGIGLDEPRRDRGMQDLLVGLGQPGHILRNLLLDVAENGGEGSWEVLAAHVRDCLQIELLQPNYAPAQPYIVCEYREVGSAGEVAKSRPLDLSNVGSGALQVILLFAFLYARPASVILLDEPDAGQHIILQKQVYDRVRRAVRDRGGQVIVATHSGTILDATEATQVLAFFGDRPGSRRLLQKSQRDQVREALKRVTTMDLLLAQETGGILYLEGQTDEKILRAWAKCLQHPAQRLFERPHVRPLGGRKLSDAKEHLFAMRAAYPDLRAVCLLDGDAKGQREREEKGVTVLYWERYEIENYLLHPEAVKRFINFPLHNPEVDQEFFKLVPQGTDWLGNHVALESVRASEKFLVPLLEKLNQETPKRDLYMLAEAMLPEEIHPEVAQKLDRIAEVFHLV